MRPSYRHPLMCGLLLLSALVLSVCSGPRVQRLTTAQYPPKPAGAPIEMVVGKWDRPYESIAIIDSKTYAKKDEASKQRMLEDLKKRARRLGADSVQDIRLLPVNVTGVVLDEGVPITGAWKQGRYQLYFLRGEGVRFVEKIGAPPAPPPAMTTAIPMPPPPTPEGAPMPTAEPALASTAAATPNPTLAPTPTATPVPTLVPSAAARLLPTPIAKPARAKPSSQLKKAARPGKAKTSVAKKPRASHKRKATRAKTPRAKAPGKAKKPSPIRKVGPTPTPTRTPEARER